MTSGLEAAYDYERDEMERKKRWREISRDPAAFCRNLKSEMAQGFNDMLLITQWLESLAEKLGTTSDLSKIGERIDSLLMLDKKNSFNVPLCDKVCEVLHVSKDTPGADIEKRLDAVQKILEQAELLR